MLKVTQLPRQNLNLGPDSRDRALKARTLNHLLAMAAVWSAPREL